MEHISEQQVIETLTEIANVICNFFGKDCEIAISNLDIADGQVLTIFNGHVTKRKVGDSLRPVDKNPIGEAKEGVFENYKKNSSKTIKSSTLVKKIGKHTYAFCINYDYSALNTLQFQLSTFLDISTDKDSEIFPNPSSVSLQEGLKALMKPYNKPVSKFTKQDRLEIIETLKGQGLLSIQKSIPIIADTLHVSRYTIYNYIKELEEN